MKNQNKTFLIITLLNLAAAGILYSQAGEIKVGEVTGIDKKSGEILVGSPKAGDDIKMGDLLFVKINGKIVELRAVFPMMTIAKCRAEGKNRSLWKNIEKGMPVYRYITGNGDVNSISKTEAASDADKKSYKVGDRGPAGGWIFYDKGYTSDGWRYLEAAPEDQSAGIQWYNGKTAAIGNTVTSTGSGKMNTQNIIAAQGKGVYAASICANYRGGGKNDWYLPSKDELEKLYKFMLKTGIGGSGSDYYWSSTEYDAEFAWYQGQNLNYRGAKYVLNRARAIRAFGN